MTPADAMNFVFNARDETRYEKGMAVLRYST